MPIGTPSSLVAWFRVPSAEPAPHVNTTEPRNLRENQSTGHREFARVQNARAQNSIRHACFGGRDGSLSRWMHTAPSPTQADAERPAIGRRSTVESVAWTYG